MCENNTKFVSTREVNDQLFRCFFTTLQQICQLHYQAPVRHEVFHLLQVSKHLYRRSIPQQQSRMFGPVPDSSPHLKKKSLATKHSFIISTLWCVLK